MPTAAIESAQGKTPPKMRKKRKHPAEPAKDIAHQAAMLAKQGRISPKAMKRHVR